MKFVPRDPVHPGQILGLDFLKEYNLTAGQLAGDIGVSIADVEALLTENAPLNADMAFRLSRRFGNSAEFWLNLQRAYDLSQALENAKDFDATAPHGAPEVDRHSMQDIADDEPKGPRLEYALSLRISGDALIPDDITRLMGRLPDRGFVKDGIFHSPKGRPIRGRTGMWSVKGPNTIEGDFDEVVAAFLSGFPALPDAWRMIAKDFRIELFVGVFMGRWNTGFALSPSVMALLAERHCAIGFDLYGMSEDE